MARNFERFCDATNILEENPYAVTFGDVFDPEYMEDETGYSSMDEFINDMPDEIEFDVELSEVPMVASLSSDDPSEQKLLDQFVDENTPFENWEDFQESGQTRMISKWMVGELEIDQ